MSDNRLDDETLKAFAAIALEQAMQEVAKKARAAAEVLPPFVDGRTALHLFADTIEATNAAVWPAEGRS